MRKTLLLGIGVILAFGIIAIPLTSYAANDTKNVTLSVKVNDGISLALDTGLNGTKHATAMDLLAKSLPALRSPTQLLFVTPLVATSFRLEVQTLALILLKTQILSQPSAAQSPTLP